MPDYRVQDYRAEDARLREAGLAAAGIYHESGAVAMRDGTDGWVPKYYVRSWPGGAAAAKKLIAVGLWSEHRLGSREGYLFRQDEWVNEQRLAVEVEEDREKARQRAQRSRRARKDRDLAASGQLTTGPVAVPPPPPEQHEPPDDDGPVTRDVTRDIDRTSRGHVTPGVTAHVTPKRHGERALLPPPPPLPRGGAVGEGAPGTERADAPEPPRLADGTNLAALTVSELEALPVRCARHRDLAIDAPIGPCPPCGDRRRAIASALDGARRRQHHAAGATLDVRRAYRDAARARTEACPDCDDHSWLVGTDGTPVEPATRCAHPRVAWADVAPTGTGGEPR